MIMDSLEQVVQVQVEDITSVYSESVGYSLHNVAWHASRPLCKADVQVQSHMAWLQLTPSGSKGIIITAVAGSHWPRHMHSHSMNFTAQQQHRNSNNMFFSLYLTMVIHQQVPSQYCTTSLFVHPARLQPSARQHTL